MAKRQCVTEFGSFVVLENDEHVGRALASGAHYERDDILVARAHVRAGSVVVDAGAHVGVWTVPLARFVGPRGRVLAFEPQAVMRALLEENVALNGLANVEVHAAALGHVDGARVALQRMMPTGGSKGRDVSYSTTEPMNYGAVMLGVGGEPCAMRALDALALDDVSLVKLDVEGAEALAAWGARATLARCRPAVVLEDIADEKKGVTRGMREVVAIPDEVARFDVAAFCLDELGYRERRRISELNVLLVP